jgi:FkbM family methyltransferase
MTIRTCLAFWCSVTFSLAQGWRTALDFGAGLVPRGGLPLGRYRLGSSEPWTLSSGKVYHFFVLEPTLDAHVSGEQLHDHLHGKSGGYHPELKALLETLLQEEPDGMEMTVLDVGANLGSFSLHAASLNVRTRAFEMQPELAMLLELGKRVNGFVKLHVHNVALWDVAGVNVSFTPRIGNLGGTALKLSADGSHALTTSRLSDLFNGAVFFLKLDCEGTEQHVLAGFSKPLVRGAVRHLYMETRANQAHVISWLYDIGFRCSPRDCDRQLVDKQTFAQHIQDPGFSANVYCKFFGPVMKDPPTLVMLNNDAEIK